VKASAVEMGVKAEKEPPSVVREELSDAVGGTFGLFLHALREQSERLRSNWPTR
jgi:hypothetical protein